MCLTLDIFFYVCLMSDIFHVFDVGHLLSYMFDVGHLLSYMFDVGHLLSCMSDIGVLLSRLTFDIFRYLTMDFFFLIRSAVDVLLEDMGDFIMAFWQHHAMTFVAIWYVSLSMTPD